MVDILSIFKDENEYLYLDIPYCEFYIPLYYFDTTRKFAEEFGDYIHVLGLFNVGIFENNKLKEMKTLNIPTMINVYQYDTEVREVQLLNGEMVQCKVLKFLKGAKIMPSILFENDDISKKYLQYIISGNVPSIVPYSKALQVWRKNLEINGVHFGVSSCYLELVLAGMSRNPNNLSQKFSKIAGDEGVTDYDYFPASIRQVCQYNSTFTAITFEDIDSMITSSLNKARDKTPENISPVEQVIKF